MSSCKDVIFSVFLDVSGMDLDVGMLGSIAFFFVCWIEAGRNGRQELSKAKYDQDKASMLEF